jgi:hypothetical protein
LKHFLPETKLVSLMWVLRAIRPLLDGSPMLGKPRPLRLERFSSAGLWAPAVKLNDPQTHPNTRLKAEARDPISLKVHMMLHLTAPRQTLID